MILSFWLFMSIDLSNVFVFWTAAMARLLSEFTICAASLVLVSGVVELAVNPLPVMPGLFFDPQKLKSSDFSRQPKFD